MYCTGYQVSCCVELIGIADYHLNYTSSIITTHYCICNIKWFWSRCFNISVSCNYFLLPWVPNFSTNSSKITLSLDLILAHVSENQLGYQIEILLIFGFAHCRIITYPWHWNDPSVMPINPPLDYWPLKRIQAWHTMASVLQCFPYYRGRIDETWFGGCLCWPAHCGQASHVASYWKLFFMELLLGTLHMSSAEFYPRLHHKGLLSSRWVMHRARASAQFGSPSFHSAVL